MKDINKLLIELIKVKSVKDNTANLEKSLSITSKHINNNKFRYYKNKNVPSLLVYNTNKFTENLRILLNAHLDVVPGKSEQFIPKIVGDKLFGRGAIDMKAAAAVMILVFKEVAHTVKYPLGLQLVTDEEVGGFNGTKHQIDKGIRADFVITGEPTNFDISNMTKGILWIKLFSKGESAHGAYPWNGTNAIKLLNKALDNIWSDYPIPTKEVWKTTVNIGKVATTNETFNKVPDQAEAWLDVRYIPEDGITIDNNIKNLLPKGVEMEIVLKEPPHNTDKNNKYIKLLKRTIKNEIGYDARVLKRNGANDVRHFNRVGCEGIEFGPVGEGLHTDNEWVSIKSLEKYYKTLKEFLLSIN